MTHQATELRCVLTASVDFHAALLKITHVTYNLTLKKQIPMNRIMMRRMHEVDACSLSGS